MMVNVLVVLMVLGLRRMLHFNWLIISERSWRWRPWPLSAPQPSGDGPKEGVSRMVLLSQCTNPDATVGVMLKNDSRHS